MTTILATVLTSALLTPATLQDPQVTTVTNDLKVTVASRGSDIRYVLFDIFSQAKKSFLVEESGVANLFLNLHNVPFEQAIDMICDTSALAFEIRDGVYVFSKVKKASAPTISNVPAAKGTVTPKAIDSETLGRKVTIRMEQAGIRQVFAELAKQSGVEIVVGIEVKNFKVNAFLVDTTLKFALTSLTQSAKLAYTFTERGTIQINDPELVRPSLKSETTNSTQEATAKLACPQCKTDLGSGWKYCPVCGHYVKNITGG